MLRQSAEDGVKGVVATPHILGDDDFDRGEELWEKFHELQRRGEEAALGVDIYLGCEVYAYPGMKLDVDFATINNTGMYFLVEFPMNAIPVFVAEAFFELILNGKTPIIAHPERYLSFIRDPQHAYDFVQRGALLQINAGSLQGVFGQDARRVSELMMDANLVHFVASDAHSANSRHPRLKMTYELVAERWGVERADTLFIDNPQRVIAGEVMQIAEPIPLELLSERRGGIVASLGRYLRREWKKARER